MPLLVLDRRPPARAARRGRRPGDRPGQAVRLRRQVVRGGGQPRARARRPPCTTARLACRAFWTAAGSRPGPVHLNLPLREPLAPVRGGARPPTGQGRADGRPVDRGARARAGAARRRTSRRWPTGWPLPRAGRSCAARRAEPVAEPGGAAGGGQRVAGAGRAHLGRALRRPRPLARGGPLRRAAARTGRSPPRTAPALVLRVGDTPTSKPLRAWLEPVPSRWCSTPTGPGTSPPARPGAPARRRGRRRATRWPPRWRCAPRSATPHGCASWRDADAQVAGRAGGGARPVRAQGRRGARARPARRRAGVGRAPRCRSATWRPSSPQSPKRSASWPTAAPTASTAWCPRPPAPRGPPARPRLS